MSNEIKAFKPRKATFKVEGEGKNRIFIAVNKRAHTVCKKAGKRTKLNPSQLKAMVGKGSYKFYAYTPKGDLKFIRL